MPSLQFDRGTLIWRGDLKQAPGDVASLFVWDDRTREWRAEARHYRAVMEACQKAQLGLHDEAKNYEPVTWSLTEKILPRDHQTAALKAWFEAKGLGTVILPTGAGKTILAVLCLAQCKRPAMIVVPTIDLMQQWERTLQRFLGVEVGLLGGGSHEIRPLTVSTYDSAALHVERFGAQFGFVIFDEAHHLPAPQYQMIARSMVAPFRLGLSATIERADAGEHIVYELVGPVIYEGHIHTLQEKVLAPYKIVNMQVPMLPEEKKRYEERRKVYTDFLRRSGIDMGSGDGWQQFIRMSARSAEGKEAMEAYRDQKRLAQGSSSKLKVIWELLLKHAEDRAIIFTDENEFAYMIGKMFFVPVLTHHTRAAERRKMLEKFRKGSIKVIVTSKVLNEGVDVPEASVAIVASGSGTVREHVQRLGRILRHSEGKVAVLYELISHKTSENYVNERRRQHYAYQGSSQLSYQ